jgi:hypothetical protein
VRSKQKQIHAQRRRKTVSIDNTISLAMLAMRKSSGGVWGRFDHGRPGVGTTEWAVIVVATVLLVAVMCISSWRAKRQKAQFLHDSKSRMFGELADVHRLSRADRRLLRNLAAARDVGHAATLFVEPDYFEAEKLPGALQGSSGELRRLRQAIFEK